MSAEMAFLLSLRGARPHLKFPVFESTLIGRSSECELQVLDPQLSRRHARISLLGDAFHIEDLESANGTFVNGSRVSEPVRLEKGDEICFGESRFVFDPPVDVLHPLEGDGPICMVEDRESAFDEGSDGQGVDREALCSILELATQLFAQIDQPAQIGSRLVEWAAARFGAERCCVLLTGQGDKFRPLSAKAPGEAIALSRTMVRRVLKTARPVLVHDALADVSFVGAASVLEHQLRSVMLAPLAVGGSAIGVIQVDKQAPRAFDQGSLAVLSLAARTAAHALTRAAQPAETDEPAASAKTQFVGSSPAALALQQVVRKAAASDARVLVRGESGTGKELVARQIHELSARSGGPFVAVNCGALPEQLVESELFGHERGAFTGAAKQKRGYFELADSGTLFLDEIAELAPAMQVKLLRAIQEGVFFRVGGERPLQVDVRVVAATNQNLEQRMVSGAFRADLFYRLNVVAISVPALRERPADIPELARHFAARIAHELGRKAPGFTARALACLSACSWPGNARQLANAVERAMVLGGGSDIDVCDLPLDTAAGQDQGSRGSLAQALAQTERAAIANALCQAQGVKAEASRLLGISRPTLDKKIAEYQLEVRG